MVEYSWFLIDTHQGRRIMKKLCLSIILFFFAPAAILSAGESAGVHWYIVEQDNPRDPPLEDVAASARYLRPFIRER